MKRGNLIPFGESKPFEDLSLKVSLIYFQMKMRVEFLLEGRSLSQVLLPEKSSHPRRLDQLWKHTCFEVFLSWGNQPHYWEINVSPSTDWNTYAFHQYRKGQSREDRLKVLLEDLGKVNANLFRLQVLLDLSQISPSITSSNTSSNTPLTSSNPSIISNTPITSNAPITSNTPSLIPSMTPSSGSLADSSTAKESSDLNVGISAVIEDFNHGKTYWALDHRGEKPDFHLRESFIWKLKSEE